MCRPLLPRTADAYIATHPYKATNPERSVSSNSGQWNVHFLNNLAIIRCFSFSPDCHGALSY
jgi:hypothetical protein